MIKLKNILNENTIDERLNNVEWEKMEKQINSLVNSCKLIQKLNKGTDTKKELMISALTSDMLKQINNLKSDIYDKARNINPN
jgi:hypothetical protein